MSNFKITELEWHNVIDKLQAIEKENEKLKGIIEGMDKAFSLCGVVGQSEQLCECKKHSIKTNYGFEVCTKCGNEFYD